MAKRWTKQKAGKQTGKKRKKGPTGSGDTASAGGTMGGFRRGFRGGFRWLAGGGDKAQSTRDRIVNVLLWVAVAVAGAFFFYKKCA